MKFLLEHLQIALLSVFALAAAPAASAQVSININPPSWGPAVPAGARYYYIPEASSFYDVPARQYVVSRDGRWIRTPTLNGYNTADFHPVIIDYAGAQPWIRYDEYRVRYPRRGGNPHGMPPGQAKKLYREGYRDGRDDDRRYERRDDERRYEHHNDDEDDHRGHGHGKYKKDKGHHRD